MTDFPQDEPSLYGSTDDGIGPLPWQLLDHGNDAVFVIDPDTDVILSANDAACDSLGYSRRELARMDVRGIQSHTTSSDAWQHLLDGAKRDGSSTSTTTHQRKDGSSIPVELNVNYVWGDARDYVIAVARNLNDAEQPTTPDERSAALSLNTPGLDASSFFHHAGNLLNSLQVSTGIIQAGAGQTRWSQLEQLLLEHLARYNPPPGTPYAALVQAIKEFASESSTDREALQQEVRTIQEKIDSLKALLQTYAFGSHDREAVDLEALTDDLIHSCRETFPLTNVTVQRSYAPVPALRLDKRCVQSVVQWMLHQAFESLGGVEGEATVKVELHQLDSETVALHITDNGAGFAEENSEIILEPTFNAHPTALGGAHTNRLRAQKLGGDLRCTSPGLGQGSTWTLLLPLRP